MFDEKPKRQPNSSTGSMIDRILIGSLAIALVVAMGLIAALLAPRLNPRSQNLYGAAEPLQLGDVLLKETFDKPDAWEYFDDGDSYLRVEDGQYRMTTHLPGYIWGLNEADHDNVIIEVETTQLSYEADNAYGVMCRADHSNNGDGYYFLISGDGFYSIRYAINNSETIDALIDYTYSDAIHQGQASNRIRAVCVGNYLGLWVNDTLVAETHDERISGGLAGLAIAVTTDYASDATDIVYDNLKITAASIDL